MHWVQDVLQNIALLLRWDMDKTMDIFYGMVRFKGLRGNYCNYKCSILFE